MNKIETSNSKISLIPCTDTPPNPPSNNMLSIAESGTNIHLAKQPTTTMVPVIISNYMTTRLPYESTMDSLHIATLHISGISKQESQIHIFPKIKIAPLISLGVFCDDGCTITLEKQDISFQTNGQEIIKGTRNKKIGMLEVPLETQQPAAVINNVMTKTSKPELEQYLHELILIPTTSGLIKSIKQGFLKTYPGLTK